MEAQSNVILPTPQPARGNVWSEVWNRLWRPGSAESKRPSGGDVLLLRSGAPEQLLSYFPLDDSVSVNLSMSEWT